MWCTCNVDVYVVYVVACVCGYVVCVCVLCGMCVYVMCVVHEREYSVESNVCKQV